MPQDFQIRPAVSADIPVLREVIDGSVRRLQAADYTPSQIDSALRTVFGVDSQLIDDGTYLGRYDVTGWHAASTRSRVRQPRSTQLPLRLAA